MVDAAGLMGRPVAADNAAMEAEPTKAEPPKRKRRRFQFSLRTLFYWFFIAACFCVLAKGCYEFAEWIRPELGW